MHKAVWNARKGNLGHGHMNYLESVIFSFYSFISSSCQHLLHLLKLTLPHPGSSIFISGWITATFSLYSLPVLSQTSFPLPCCKIVAVPSSWLLNLIKFDGSRSSFCPKRADTTGSHVFFDCLSPLQSLASRAAWKGGGAVKTGQHAKEIKLLLKESPDIKISGFFRRCPLYRWNCTFRFECISFPCQNC